MTAFVSNRLVIGASFAAKLSPAQNHFIDWYKISDGVALAAIQGLNEKVEVGSQRAEVRSRKLEEELQQKETEIAELKQAVNELKQLVGKLAGERNGAVR